MKHEQEKKSRICVLLTASVDPKGCSLLERANPAVRECDYITALKTWIRKTDYPIVFCENSGYDLSRIKNAADSRLSKGREIEFLQFEGNDYPRMTGKGYGELLILRHAVEHSGLIGRCDYIVKVTGRFFVKNIGKIVEPLSLGKDYFVMHDREILLQDRPCFSSSLFVSRPEFIRDYLAKYQDSINDQNNFYFEHGLYLAVNDSVRDGFKCSYFIEAPKRFGYDGTRGFYISAATTGINDRVKKILKAIIPKRAGEFLKKFLDERF